MAAIATGQGNKYIGRTVSYSTPVVVMLRTFKQSVGGKQIMGDGYLAVTHEGLQVGCALSTDRASHMIPDAKLLPHALGLLGLRHDPRVPNLYQTSPTP
jgi:hypothetical protein